MYWYLSFLRPPPVSTPSGGSVTITPQIANDLRTELRDEPVDIYYTWQRLPLPLSHSAHSTSASSSHSHPAEMYPTSNPVLLTRWDPPMSTYKPLTLPIPPLAKSGESWRLSLFVQSDTPSTGSISKPGFPTRSGFVPGSDHRLGPSNRAEKLLELGCPVLGVWSEGIRITPSSSSRVAPAEVGSVGSRSTVVGGAGGGSKKAGHTHGPDPGGGRNKKGQYKDDGKGKGKGKGGGGEGESVPKQSRITREFSWTLPLSGSTPSHGATTPSPAPHSSCTHSTLHPHAQRPVPVRQILRIIEQTSFDLDKKIWDSGLALGAWLWRDIVTPSAQSGSERRYGQHDELVQDVLQRCQGRVVELGSGTGLVGIMLYLALRNAGRYGTQDGERGRGEIVATDLPSAIELMQENISLNASDSITDAPSHIAPCPDTPKGENDRSGDSSALADIDLPRSFSEISHIGSTLHARVLDWDEPLPSWISSGLCGSTDGTGGVVESTWPDLVIAADVTYNTASFPSLLQTLISFLNPQHPYTNPDVPSGPNINGTDAANKPKPDIQRPLLLLAYKERDPAERDLWLMLAERGVKMVCVDKVQGAEAKGETEIWVGRHVGDAASA